MLKKAGIVVAATATTLLVLSPLAYAGGSHEVKNRHGAEQSAGAQQQDPPGGLIDDINVLNGVNVCPDVNVSAALGNVLGILGLGSASTTTADAPITCSSNNSGG